jgi:hypothetical protein
MRTRKSLTQSLGCLWGTAGFAKAGVADGLLGSGMLAVLADAAAGPDDGYASASDGELGGVIAAWDRVEAHAGRDAGAVG